MTDPRAFLALDLGTATTSAALIARVRHRWRLIGSLAMPAAIDVDAIVGLLLERSQAADPELARTLGYDGRRAAPTLPRLIARSVPPQRLVAVAASDRAVTPLANAARRTGWRVSSAESRRDGPAGDDRRRPGPVGRRRARRRRRAARTRRAPRDRGRRRARRRRRASPPGADGPPRGGDVRAAAPLRDDRRRPPGRGPARPARDSRRARRDRPSASCSTTSGRHATTRAGRSPAGRPRSPTRSIGASRSSTSASTAVCGPSPRPDRPDPRRR